MPLFSSSSRSAKYWWRGGSFALLGAIVVLAKMMNTNPPTNVAETAPGSADLRTRLYEVTPDEAAKKIAVMSLSTYGRSWKVIEQKHVSTDETRFVFHVPVIVFTDVLTVTLERKEGEKTQVNVESHSQAGQGDFGENRRHVRQILGALDKAFA